MADSKISELTALTSPASDDVLAIVDTDAGVTKKITVSNLQSSSFQFVLEDGDGTEVTINNNNEVKFVEGGGIDINWTDTTKDRDWETRHFESNTFLEMIIERDYDADSSI